MKKLFENVEGNCFKLLENHGETDMSNPAEEREVQIGHEIISRIRKLHSGEDKDLLAIEKLAQELIDIHSQDGPVMMPGTGPKALYKRGSIY